MTVPPVVEAGTMANAEQPVINIDDTLLLRPWKPGDAATAIEAFATPDIQFFHSRRLDSEAEALEWIEFCAEGWRKERSATWAVVDRQLDQIIGRVSINTELKWGSGEVAYWMLPAGRGRGVATRACVVATRWAHGIGIHRVELEHSTTNKASRKVALAAGYIEEGTRRESNKHGDGWHDMRVYSKLASDP